MRRSGWRLHTSFWCYYPGRASILPQRAQLGVRRRCRRIRSGASPGTCVASAVKAWPAPSPCSHFIGWSGSASMMGFQLLWVCAKLAEGSSAYHGAAVPPDSPRFSPALSGTRGRIGLVPPADSAMVLTILWASSRPRRECGGVGQLEWSHAGAWLQH